MTEQAGAAPSAWARAVEVVSVLGPPATVATALLVYFGWARADAQAEVMGLDVALFGYTAQDYALRSVGSLYRPLLWLSAVALVWVWADAALQRRLAGGLELGLTGRTVLAALTALAVLVAEVAVLAVLAPVAGAAYTPYCMALGVLLAAWALRIHRWTRPHRRDDPAVGVHRAVGSALVFGLVTLLLFWGTANAAQLRGQEQAVRYQQAVGAMPRAQVFSGSPLELRIHNVQESRLGTAADPVYRYDGLRLLTVSGGRYFFLHDGWTVAEGRVVVLPDDDSVRVVYGR